MLDKALNNRNVCSNWCMQNGTMCYYRQDSRVAGWLPRKDGNPCVGAFYGHCNKGNRYIPVNMPRQDQIAVVKRGSSGALAEWYDSFIDEEFDIIGESADVIFVDACRVGVDIPGHIYRIDCIIKPKGQ